MSPSQLLVVVRGWGKFGVGAVCKRHSMKLLAELDQLLELLSPEVPVKRLGTKTGPTARYVGSDIVFSKSHPTLFAFLCDTEYEAADGGGKREPGIVTFWVSGGLFNAKLTDKDSGQVCYCAAASWGLLLNALDASCADPAGGWRPDPGLGRGKKR